MKHPLSINFKTIEQYNFTKIKPDEVFFFEWLVLKRNSFGNDTFYYQQRRIINELGIRRNRLESIKGNFISNFSLEVTNGGFNNVTYFVVTNKFIESFVKVNIKDAHQKDLLRRLLSFEFNHTNNLTSEKIEEVEYKIQELEEIYNGRRELANKGDTGRELSRTSLAHNKTTEKQLCELMNKYSEGAIENSFIAFSDAIIGKKDSTSHMLNNFTSYDKEQKKFGVFEFYLEIFNNDYSIKK